LDIAIEKINFNLSFLEMSINIANKSSRLTGIDLFRGIAIYAVIILHADEGIWISPIGWEKILEFSGFAVPFFLATSFYLAFNKIYATGGQYELKPRLTRLLIPYLFWTGIYIGYKALKYLVQNEYDHLNGLFQDPVALIFFGGAAFQLYFLPLLASGTLFIKPISWLIKEQTHLKLLVILSILSLISYELLLISGNEFNNVSGMAFQTVINSSFLSEFKDNPFLRILLVEIAFIIRCLPYLCIALLINHPHVNIALKHKNVFYILIILGVFFIINLFGSSLLPESIHEIGRGYIALLLGLALSNYLLPTQMIRNFSLCAFGIYLSHLLFVDIFQIIENRIYPGAMFRISTPNLLIFAMLVFIISWIATDLLMKRKFLAKLMFGV
jgi:hypothetical protein